ncbi:mechanosensitive ion channel family protein [Prevotella sp. AGR2160]|uniref:mechanosensitive ion channel family protein n=1 Tax=Prevotella sp. AGR2160 TaxID=1280674 RepID=UPI00048AB555|nr:mechanosensitive ion channel domain-containing protein [Prevotella sp. AGR2160]
MEKIRILIEQAIMLAGVHGPAVHILRHVLLIVVAVLLAALAGWFCRKVLMPLAQKITAKTEATWDEILFNERVLRALCAIVPAIVIWKFLPMVFYQFPLVRELLARATAIYITIMATRAVTIFIGSFDDLEGPEMGMSEGRSAARQYLKSFCGVLKIVAIFVSVIIVVAIALDKSPLHLFAGLGATSAILMLVFKDTIEGLVAGIRLTSNDMLHAGDWITVPSANANGIVQEMTLSTVKIRNFDNTITTVSPLSLINGSFQNWRNMQEGGGRRVKRILYLDFRSIKPLSADDINRLPKEAQPLAKEGEVNLTVFRAFVEHWLRHREDVNAKMTLMVRQMEPTQCGLPIEFYFFLKEKVWVRYEHTQAAIFEYLYAVIPSFGLKIYQQYPEQ